MRPNKATVPVARIKDASHKTQKATINTTLWQMQRKNYNKEKNCLKVEIIAFKMSKKATKRS